MDERGLVAFRDRSDKSGQVGVSRCTSAGSPSPAPTPPVADANPCELLTEDELAALAGKAVSDARPGETAGAPNCQWSVGDGRVVQVISTSASDWATALPDAIRQLEASGLLAGSAQQQTLKDAAALVEGGGRVEADKACDLFSELLELRGDPPGTERTVNVFPSKDAAQGVAGQVCSGGRFTSVSLQDAGGLIEPLPVEEVNQALDQAHRRAVG